MELMELSPLQKLGRWLVLACGLAFTLFPVLWVLSVAFRPAGSFTFPVEVIPPGLTLDNFGTVRFSQASVVRDTQVLNISQSGAHPITMITPAGLHLAEPSALGDDGESFSVTRTSTPSPSPGGSAPGRRRGP